MKKIISLLLCILMLAGSVESALAYTLSKEDGSVIGEETATEPSDDTNSDAEDFEEWTPLELLYGLGIADDMSLAYSSLDEPISKAFFLYFLGNMYFYNENQAEADNDYTDVGINHYASGYVERFRALGIVDGVSGSYLDADKKLSADEAYKLAVCALGYGSIKEVVEKGYPAGYTEMAHKLKINVGIKDNSKITRREAVELLYNMLDTEVLLNSLGDADEFVRGGKFIEENMGITVDKAVVYSIGKMTIGGKTVADNKVVIGDNVLETEEVFDRGLIGKYVKYYFDEDAEKLIFVTEQKNSSLNIHSDDIKSYSSGYLVYKKDKSNKRARIATDLTILKNGRAANSISALMPEYGDVTLVDNDNDGAYDIAIVNEYEVYYVAALATDKKSVTLENSIKTTVIRPEDYDETVMLDAQGNEVTLAQFKKGTAVMVRTAEDFLQLTLLNEKNEGYISEVVTDDGKVIYTIGDADIKVTPMTYLENVAQDSLPDGNVTVILDIYGQAAAMVAGAVSDDGWKLGFLYSVSYNELDDEYYFTIGDQYAEFSRYVTTREKIKYDGKKEELSYIMTVIPTKTVIRYKTQEGEILAIDTPETLDFFDERNKRLIDSEYDCLYKRVSGTLSFVEHMGAFVGGTNGTTGVGSLFKASGCINYAVPVRAELAYAAKDDISIVNGSYTNGDNYDFDTFSVGKDTMTASAVMSYGFSNASTGGIKWSKAMLVTSRRITLDEDDEPCIEVKGYISQEGEKTYYTLPSEEFLPPSAEEEPYFVSDLSTIKKGDIIRFTIDRDNKINYCFKEYTSDGTGRLNIVGYSHSDSMWVNRYVNAKLLKYSNGVLAFQDVNGMLKPELLSISSTYAQMYVFDRDTGKATPATADDIQLAVKSSDNFEAVIIGSYQQQSRDVILIR